MGFNFDSDGGYIFAKNSIFKNSVAPYEESVVSEVVNSALNSRGGVIYGHSEYYNSPGVYIENCTFINNTAEYGGAIFVDDGAVIIINSSFVDNYAYNFGGALVFWETPLLKSMIQVSSTVNLLMMPEGQFIFTVPS